MKLLLTCAFISLSAIAQPNFETCSELAQSYGDKHTPSFVPGACFEKLKELASPKNISTSEDGQVLVYAKDNMVYLEKKIDLEASVELLAGPQTKLFEAKDIELSEQENRFYVLNRNESGSQVFSYTLEYGGNLAPLRKLISPELAQASDITIDFADKKLLISSQDGGWVKIFNLHADPDGRREENSTKTLATLSNELNSPIDTAVSETEIFVLEDQKISIYSKEEVYSGQEQSESSPIAVLDGASSFGNVTGIKFDSNENALRVYGKEGVISVFYKDQFGNYIRP